MKDILVVGPGALGILFAVRFHESGRSVALFDYLPDRAERLNREGICLRMEEEEIRCRVPVCVAGEEALPDEYKVVLLCVKSYSTEGAADNVSPYVGERTLVVTLQNGLDNVERLAKRFGEDRVLAGTTSEGATLLAEGRVRHAGRGKTVVGALSAERNPDAQTFVTWLQGAGFEASWISDWRSALWTKAVLNAAINPVTAILGVNNGVLTELEPLRRLVTTIAQEAEEIARRCGVTVPDTLAEEALLLCHKTAQNRSSMLQDVERGSETELENINGVLLKEAKRHHIEVGALRAVTEMARARALLARHKNVPGR